jgi:hypothetical protein
MLLLKKAGQREKKTAHRFAMFLNSSSYGRNSSSVARNTH